MLTVVLMSECPRWLDTAGVLIPWLWSMVAGEGERNATGN
jgi:hypothetical protein